MLYSETKKNCLFQSWYYSIEIKNYNIHIYINKIKNINNKSCLNFWEIWPFSIIFISMRSKGNNMSDDYESKCIYE